MDERGRVSRIGVIVVAVGAAAVLLGLTVLPWYRIPSPPGFYGHFFSATNPTFLDVRHGIQGFQSLVASQGISKYVSFGVAASYFGWLGWVLLVLAAGFAAVSVSPFGAHHWSVHWAAAVAAFAGGGVTITALDLVTFAGNPPANARPPSFTDFISQSSLAPWVVVGGYTLILAGAFAPHPTDNVDRPQTRGMAPVRRK
jgi:hypothetical protein